MASYIDWGHLIQDREVLETILNTISEGIAIIDLQGKYMVMNEAYHQILSYQEEKMTGMMNYSILAKNNKYISMSEYILKEIKKGNHIKHENLLIKRNRKERYICLSSQPIMNKEGIIEYAVVCLHDVTKIKKQSERIRQQKEYIHSIIQALATPVAVISYPECTYKYVNKEYVELIIDITRKTLDHHDLIGSSLHEVLPFECADVIKQIAEEIYNEPWTIQKKMISYKASKGQDKHYQMLHTSIKYNDVGKMHIVMIGMDITSEVVLRQETETLTKAKEEFFATVSHELRSPIAVMHSIFQMLNDDYYKRELNEKTRKLLKKAQRNNRKLLRLVNNFLDITKAEAGFMQLRQVNADLVKYTQYLVKTILPIVEKKKIQLNFISTCSTKRIVLDIEKYERILLNLLSNAVKYTQHEGKIDVYIHEDDRYIKVGVKDNGRGIPKGEVDKIFDRFYISCSTEKKPNEGTGIGLSLVKSFMQLMEGEIEVNSRLGEGSEFILSFPKKLKDTTEYTVVEELQSTKESVSLEFSTLYD